MTLGEIDRMSDEERKKLFPPVICPRCKKEIPRGEEPQGELPHQSEGEIVCSDCYFEAMGEEVEKHPIGRHLGPRGCR